MKTAAKGLNWICVTLIVKKTLKHIVTSNALFFSNFAASYNFFNDEDFKENVIVMCRNLIVTYKSDSNASDQ